MCVPRLGFDKAVEEAKSRMARYNATPNMLIVPPQEKKSALFEPSSHTEANTSRSMHTRSDWDGRLVFQDSGQLDFNGSNSDSWGKLHLAFDVFHAHAFRLGWEKN